jgi:hypothetical protein
MVTPEQLKRGGPVRHFHAAEDAPKEPAVEEEEEVKPSPKDTGSVSERVTEGEEGEANAHVEPRAKPESE